MPARTVSFQLHYSVLKTNLIIMVYMYSYMPHYHGEYATFYRPIFGVELRQA